MLSEVAISQLERLRWLHKEFLVEPDTARKHEILDELLTLVQDHWIHFVGLVADEQNPARLQSLVDELDQILEARRARSANPMRTPPSDLPPKRPGTERDE